MFYEQIFEEFNEQGVKYVIVGGLAAVIHGSPRFTHDIDLVIELSDQNIERLMEILTKHGYRPKVPVEPMDFADASKREEWINEKNMKAFNLRADDPTQPEVDILIDNILFEDMDVEVHESNDIELPVASIDDLIEMKKKADRDLDQLDIKYLQQIKREKDDE